MMEQAVFQKLKISSVIPTADNPRLINEDSDKFKILAASVAAEGVLEPVKVRPHPKKKGKFDLRDGARRLLASQMAGLKEIPALVYENMTEAEAFEMTFIPFFGREDLTPIEEAKAVSLYLEKNGGDTKVVADKLGQTERWVKLRANVFENLDRAWISEIEDDDEGDFADWTISHLELIARFGRETQKRLCDGFQPWRIKTVKDLSDWCNDQLRLLKNTGWVMDDVLADADGVVLPTCNECPKRSGCQQLLWEEFETDPLHDRCLDSDCFEKKQQAVVQKALDAAKAQYPNLKLISRGSKNKYLRYREEKELKEKHPDVVFVDMDTAKKSDPDAVPCMVMSGKSAGKIRWRKPSKKKSGSSPAGASGKAGGKTLKQKRDELGRKRWAQVLNELHDLVAECGLDRIRCSNEVGLQENAMLVLVWQFGVYNWFGQGGDFELINKMLDPDGEVTESHQIRQILTEIWEEGVRPQILSDIKYNGPVTQTPDDKIADAGQVAKLLGIDIDALHAKACADIREPKSWSKPAPQKAKGAA